jgi:tRNA threonylcarbamoyladenosine modification (KEOPS) complex  Pcc1 subunit
MKAKATVRLKFETEEQLHMVLNALRPEVRNPSIRRAGAVFDREGDALVLNVEADDTVALRASLNAYLRWMNSILDVLEALKTQ